MPSIREDTLAMRPVAAIALLCLYATPSAAFLGPVLHRPAVLLRPHASHAPLPAAAEERRAAPPLALEPQEEANAITLDTGGLGRYVFAVLLQLLGITTFFGFVDLACFGPLPGHAELGGPLPWQGVVAIFLLLSVRSRFFNPLNNARPELETGTQSQQDRIMPSWTPPGVTFPIMWVLVVAPLRAFAASTLYEASTGRMNEGHLNDPVLLWLVLHLCIGDTWNTVNNVERRTGAAVPGVVLVWGSALFAAAQYYDVAPTAGLLLGATGLWITVAGALVADTWRVNNARRPEPLYPYKEVGTTSQTRFFFE